MALEFLSKCISLPAGVTAQSIAEGHREKTLTLLWAIIFNFKVHIQSKHTRVHLHVMYSSLTCTCTCRRFSVHVLLCLLDTITSTYVHVYGPLYIARAFVCPCAHTCTCTLYFCNILSNLSIR